MQEESLLHFLRDAMDRAAAEAQLDWTQYFTSIVGVCPWALAAWKQGRIDIREGDLFEDLATPFVARLYILRGAPLEQLQILCGKLNTERSGEEWLYSHPQNANNSTPVPVLIQQDLEYLKSARSGNNMELYRRNPR